MTGQNLSVGIISTDKFLAAIIKEVLGHIGIFFEEVDQKTSENFPCIILPTHNEADFSIASRLCNSVENILIFDEEFSIKAFYLALGGFLEYDRSTNKLKTPKLSLEQYELLEKIKNCFSKSDLPLIRKWYWPKFADACFVSTHDIDSLDPILRISNLKGRIGFNWLRFLINLVRKQLGKEIFKIILDENRRELRSTFLFFPDYGNSYKDFLYILKLLKQLNFEVGLHGSEFSYYDRTQLETEKKQLEKILEGNLKGIRHHQLNFLPPFTWRYQEKAGFIYDLSFSYSTDFGFRSGICFPYHPVDIIERKRFDLIELPTSFMDWTVLYRHMNYNEAWNTLMELANVIEKLHGCFVVNFHNAYQNKDFPLIEKLYSKLLDHITRKNYWITSAGKCSSWWLRREKTKLNAFLDKKTIQGNISSPLPIIIEKDEDIIKLDLKKTDFVISIKD